MVKSRSCIGVHGPWIRIIRYPYPPKKFGKTQIIQDWLWMMYEHTCFLYKEMLFNNFATIHPCIECMLICLKTPSCASCSNIHQCTSQSLLEFVLHVDIEVHPDSWIRG